MQWSDERNAGFSTADPLQVVNPVIGSGPFGCHNVNVAAQLRDPQSLLQTQQEMFRSASSTCR